MPAPLPESQELLRVVGRLGPDRRRQVWIYRRQLDAEDRVRMLAALGGGMDRIDRARVDWHPVRCPSLSGLTRKA